MGAWPSFSYRLAVRLFEILRLRRMWGADRDIEIVVLRHQLDVLRRQVSRTSFEPADRELLSLLGRLLPRRRWSAFLVTPATVLRWHREPSVGAGPILIDVSAGRLSSLPWLNSSCAGP